MTWLRSTLGSIAFIIIFSCLLIFWDEFLRTLHIRIDASTASLIKKYVASALILVIAWFLIKFINFVFIDVIITAKLKHPPPQIIKSLVGICLLLITLLIIFTEVLDKDVGALMAGSGIAVFVIGFATRGLISDYTNSIVINIDKPYEIGDWLSVMENSIDGFYGKVQEITWRTTRIQTTDKGLVILANSKIGNMAIKNHTKMTENIRLEAYFTFDPIHDVELIRKHLYAALSSAPHIEPGPKSDVLIKNIDKRGVIFLCRYWFNPDIIPPDKACNEIHTHALLHLRQAGINPGHIKLDHYFSEVPAPVVITATNKKMSIERSGFFSCLNHEEINLLCQDLKTVCIDSEQYLMRQGDAGGSMYIIKSGCFEVFINIEKPERKEQQSIAILCPGQVVGEMSLLTGALRSASIQALVDSEVYEISKPTMQKIISNRPLVAEQLSKIMIQRQTATQRSIHEKAQDALSNQSIIKELTQRVKSYFRL